MPNRQPLILAGQQPYVKPPRLARVDMEHPLARKMVQSFLFNEGAGFAVSSINPAHRVTLGSGVSWVASRLGPALHFNDSLAGQAVLTQGFTPSATAFSVDMAVRIVTNPVNLNYEYLFGSQVAAGEGLLLTADSGKGIAGWDFDSTTGDVNTTSARSLNTWYHLVWVYVSSASAIIYENGVSVASGALGGSFTPPLGWMGSDGTNTPSQFSGDMAWLRIWDRALSATEAKALYSAPWDMMVAPNERLWTVAMMGGTAAGGTTPITVSDSLSGADSVSLATITPAVSDSLAGGESITLATITLSVADALAASDTPAILVQIPISDALSGGDSASIGTVAVSVGDALAGGDSTAVTVSPFSVADSATGSESVSLATISIPISDALTGAESLSVAVTQTISDSLSGGDSPSLLVQIPISDTLTGAELQSITATLTVSDSLAGGDSVSVANGAVSITVNDSLTGAESVAIGPVAVPVSDSLTGGESLAFNLPVSVVLNDSGLLGETPTLATIPLTIGDALSGSQSVTLLIQPAVVDTLSGADTPAVQVGGITVLDNATGAEALSFVISGVVATDAATGQDAVALTITQTIADPLVGGEGISINVILGVGFHGGPIVQTSTERFSITTTTSRPTVGSTFNFRPGIGGTSRT